MMPWQMMGLIAAATGVADPRAQALGQRGDRAWALVEERLGEADYLAGDEFTAADIIMLFPLTTLRAFAARDLAAYPNIRAYLARIGERPAYRRAMEKGDPKMTPMLS
jgi:glutathione S-transferase